MLRERYRMGEKIEGRGQRFRVEACMFMYCSIVIISDMLREKVWHWREGRGQMVDRG